MISSGFDAWLLHKHWSGETSARVTFFTREHGVIVALCKGGRAPKKQSTLQPFTPLWLACDVRNDWHYVRQLDITAPSLILNRDALFAGLYINELLYHGIRQLDACPNLYDAYQQTLNALTILTDRLAIEVILRRFEWQFLNSLGYQMSLTHDALTADPIDASKQYTFIAGEGVSLAPKGISGAYILAIAEDNLGDVNVLKAAKWIMRRAIDHALDGKRIMARELYA